MFQKSGCYELEAKNPALGQICRCVRNVELWWAESFFRDTDTDIRSPFTRFKVPKVEETWTTTKPLPMADIFNFVVLDGNYRRAKLNERRVSKCENVNLTWNLWKSMAFLWLKMNVSLPTSCSNFNATSLSGVLICAHFAIADNPIWVFCKHFSINQKKQN